jgi:hypothetical protein
MHGRRRRSHAAAWLAAAAAFLVLAGAAATVLLVRTDRDEPDQAAALDPPVEPATNRRADQITLDIDPISGLAATAMGTDSGRQFVSVRDLSGTQGGGSAYAGEVSVYDPGTFDSAPLRGGEVVDVEGRDAWYVPEYAFAALSEQDAPHRGPAVGWADPSGVWILAYSGPGGKLGRDDLIRLAGAVTLTPPRDLRTPFRVGETPDDLAVTYVRSDEVTGEKGGAIGLSDPRRKPSSAAVYTGAPYGVAVAVTATVPDDDWATERRTLSDEDTVAGHPAWYTEGRNMLSPEGKGSTLIVETGPCVLRLRAADRKAVTRAELVRTVEEMTVGDCDVPDTWLTPLP